MSDRLQHLVAYPVALLVGLRRNHGLLDQTPEEQQHVLVARRLVPTYRFGGLQGEAAGEHRQSREQVLLGFGEQIVAPVEGRPHRPLAVREIPRSACRERLVQPRQEMRRAQKPHLRRRQLQRQGQPGKAPADDRYRPGVLALKRERRGGGPGALHEEADGPRAGKRLDGRGRMLLR